MCNEKEKTSGYGFDDVVDTRALTFLQRYISSNAQNNDKLSGILLCGSRIIPTGKRDAVFLVSNLEDQSRLYGLACCHSPWACPRCSPRVMSDKGTDIACAIDALVQNYNQYAFMATFTLPHTKRMSAADSFFILKDTWRLFTRAGNGTSHLSKKYTVKSDVGDKRRNNKSSYRKTHISDDVKKGDVVVYQLKSNEPYGQFRRELGITHWVKVYEFTYSEENGWHPHIHLLMWVPKHNFDKVLKYRESLLQHWWDSAKKAALNYWNKINPDKKEENAKSVEEYYSEWRKSPKDGHRSVYFSVDKNGKLIPQKSSFYITGWSSNHEMTGLSTKVTKKEGHYTPFQLIGLAMNNPSQKDKWMSLFLEYATVTRGSRRVEFSSQSGIRKIINKWKQTEAYTNYLKKKAMGKGTKPWKVVCWFTRKQWFNICLLDWDYDHEIKATLLKMARAPDKHKAFDEIYQYLLAFDIDIMENGKHPLEEVIENQIFENKAFEKENSVA